MHILMGCHSKTSTNNTIDTEKALLIKNQEVLKTDLLLNQLEGRWYYKDKPYFGYSVKYHQNNTLAERLGYVNGKREGTARQWSDKGVLRIASNYKNNRLNGDYITWWDNGIISSKSHYVNGKKQGLDEEWYPNGQLAKHRQLVDGKENGLQKAWLKNGTLYVNYEAKNGRIFGMKRANSCYKLEDEIIIRDKKI
ncbi:hypothetical protein FNB79_01195 [Formosa sediminum]|uniref:Toxin-antitoxin system YwqK family antitoxin n=2 Tax=Formosa sediminum TaxID=2594004 RepID=A0A516GVV0_9FLAO|nr:hypothetical protein FNB79_01195 [Formosa sediminum]